MDRTYVLFHPCWQCYDRRGVFCCLVSIVVDEHCHMVLPSACHGDFTFRVSSCLKTKINYDFHNLTKDTVELPTITNQKVQCWTVGTIFTFGRSRMFSPEKLWPLAVGRSRSRRIKYVKKCHKSFD